MSRSQILGFCSCLLVVTLMGCGAPEESTLPIDNGDDDSIGDTPPIDDTPPEDEPSDDPTPPEDDPVDDPTPPEDDPVDDPLPPEDEEDPAVDPDPPEADPDPEAPIAVAISNLSPSSYSVDRLITGAQIFGDRDYVYVNPPNDLTNWQVIITDNNDKLNDGDNFISFTIDREATVIVAHDSRITSKPTWLSSWTLDTEQLSTSDGFEFQIYYKTYEAGDVSLGGNIPSGFDNTSISMYTVILPPSDGTVIEDDPIDDPVEEDPVEEDPVEEDPVDPDPVDTGDDDPIVLPDPTPLPDPVPVGEEITDIRVTPQHQAGVVANETFVTFGQVFKAGEVLSSDELEFVDSNAFSIPTQIDTKALHADGSVRHVIATTILDDLTGGTTSQLRFVKPTEAQANGSDITIDDLLASDFNADISLNIGGEIYSASARELLSNGELQTWLSGPLVSEWIVSGYPENTSDSPHSHLFIQFHIRAYKGLNTIRVSYNVENAWSYANTPSNVDYNVTLTLNDTVRFQETIDHHHHARWRKTYWTAGSAPHIALNSEYLIATGAVPNYDTSLNVPESDLDSMASTWENKNTGPMGEGVAETYMPATGGRIDIGPLPRWSARYILSMDPRAAQTTFGSGDLAGSWPIHYRDKNTLQPLSVDDYPYVTLVGNKSDTYNPDTDAYENLPSCEGSCSTDMSPDVSHQPSLAYLPYLTTGDYFYLDEMKFWVAYNLLRPNPGYRRHEEGLLKSEQTRGQAWALRELGYATYITPDADAFKSYAVNKLENNLDYYNENYVYNAEQNTLGWIHPTIRDGGTESNIISPWMDDFFTWTVGHLVDMGYTDWNTMLIWKAEFPIGRMTANGYCWISAAPYRLQVRDTSNSPYYSSFAELYSVHINDGGTECGSQAMADYYDMEVGEMTGHAHSSTGYPANLQPALAVSNRDYIDGGSAAWTLYVSRSVKPDYDSDPTWAIVPR